ncbi:MAG: Homoserine dehydrogenase [Candidatus Omnitrophica bacterium]|nr:Homoserine dehydrogenase [Candidatus Omnitrophota bacterium]
MGIALIGCGTVGTGVVRILQSEIAAIQAKTGIRLELKAVCVRNPRKKRAVRLPARLLTTDPHAILRDPSIDIVVELIGGIAPARDLILEAFRHGKHVVTANKALLAEAATAIYGEAAKHRRLLGIEASVCGGIPIIRSLREGLTSNNISHFMGIVNGTCNYILSAMSRQNSDFTDALADAQSMGYAEQDPSLDIDGIDSAHKLAVLARLAFRSEVPFDRIPVEGIRSLSAVDMQYASELGYAIKLLAIGKRDGKGLDLRVHPTLLPKDHPLSNVHGVYNAVFMHGDHTGDLLFYGKGAGMLPTASAVMSDIIAIAKAVAAQSWTMEPAPEDLPKLPVLPADRIASRYYLRFQVADRPGVLGNIARTLGQHDISILSVQQKGTHGGRSVPVIILTYTAREADLRAALRQIDRRPDVRQRTVVLRVDG